MVPRASGFQYGAPRPVKAGTIITPPESGTLSASACTSRAALDGLAGRRAATAPRRRRRTRCPPSRTRGCAEVCAALVVSRPLAEVWKLRAGVHQQEAAGAVGVLGHALAESRPGRTARSAGRRPRRRSRPARPAATAACRRSARWRAAPAACSDAGMSSSVQQLGVPALRVHVEQHGARGVADVGGVQPAARSAATSASCRRCRRPVRRARPARARPARCRAAS